MDRFPENYKDPNHKPEMAIALTPFEALSGFRSVAEIKANLTRYGELRVVVGEGEEVDAYPVGAIKRLNICPDFIPALQFYRTEAALHCTACTACYDLLLIALTHSFSISFG